jgi:ribosomal protein L18
VRVSNSTNINKTNFYFSPQIIEHKENNDIMSIEMHTLTLNRHLHMAELSRFV